MSAEGVNLSKAYWKELPSFGLYLPDDSTKQAVLQLNVDSEAGDKSKWSPSIWSPTESLSWFDSETPGRSWSLNISYIGISEGFYHVYAATHSREIHTYTWSQNIVYDPQPAAFGSDVPYQNQHLFDSCSRWTRFHPFLTNRVYDKIIGATYYRGTYYIPCNTSEDSLPDVKLMFKEPLPAHGNPAAWPYLYSSSLFHLNKQSFIERAFVHPKNRKNLPPSPHKTL
ncbi:hypothetical protein ABW19_dt0201517 [Dactylella cylindrospora]|nr:hypothetical protein ABW19_dt0201517 [Dactylella cylindrospora]